VRLLVNWKAKGRYGRRLHLLVLFLGRPAKIEKTNESEALARIEKDLDTLAGRLEDAGFNAQRDLLDKAADHVENVQEAFASL
jgi:hypothetical protein